MDHSMPLSGEVAASSPSKAKVKPQLSITARIDSYGGGLEGDHSWLQERHARLKKEIAAAEDAITNWDPEEVARQALAGLKADLAQRRAELMSCEAEMDAKGADYSDGADSEEADAGEDSADAAEGDDAGEGDDAAEGEGEDGKVLKTGNPYSIINRGGKFVIENNETGKVKGSHPTYKKALRQFNLLEMIEHGGTPRER